MPARVVQVTCRAQPRQCYWCWAYLHVGGPLCFAINVAIVSWKVKAPRGIPNVDRCESFMRTWLAKCSNPHIELASSIVARPVAEFVAAWWLV